MIPVREWWLAEARAKVKKDERNDWELAELFHRALGATVKGTRSYLNRFKNGRSGATLPLIEALCTEYVSLPRPLLFFESEEESYALQDAATRIREKRRAAGHVSPPPPPPPPPTPRRRKQNKLKGSARDELAALRERTRPQR